jgi:hypothetical protein
MKAILEFDLTNPEDREQHTRIFQGQLALDFLFDVEQEVFRPARKHGYPDSPIGRRLNQLIESNPEAGEIIGLLEDLYYRTKEESGLVLD